MRRNNATWVALIVVIVAITATMNLWPDVLKTIGINRDLAVRLGLDLQGGSQVVLQARPDPTITDQSVLASNLRAARDVVEERAAGSGVSEPLVQVQGNNRILVELPGVKNPDDVVKTLRETGYLEWIDAGANPIPEGSIVTTEKGPPTPEQIRAYQASQGITTTETLTGTNAFQTYNNGQVFPVVVTGAEIDGTKVSTGINSQNGTPQVSFQLKGQGPAKLQQYTQSHIGQYMPIVLDKVVVASPVIQGVIPNGQGQIDHMTASDAQRLAIQLRYGALPVGLDVVANRTVGPTLGAEGVDKSLIAGIVGLSLVMVFMLLYYHLPGLLADIALLIFACITFAIFRAVPVTLTLAGIAGFILSIGMAVDANVLIFARLKEELRSGKTVAAAVEAGFDHAWPSIRDSNMTTVIITLILYWFGNFFGASVIKGFALTLLISVLVSLFTAITVTRTLLRLVVSTRMARNPWWFGVESSPRPTLPPEGGTQPAR